VGCVLGGLVPYVSRDGCVLVGGEAECVVVLAKLGT